MIRAVQFLMLGVHGTSNEGEVFIKQSIWNGVSFLQMDNGSSNLSSHAQGFVNKCNGDVNSALWELLFGYHNVIYQIQKSLWSHIIHELIDLGADVTQVEAFWDAPRNTPIVHSLVDVFVGSQFCKYKNVFTQIWDAGFDVNVMKGSGSAFHVILDRDWYVSRDHREDIARLMISRGADLNVRGGVLNLHPLNIALAHRNNRFTDVFVNDMVDRGSHVGLALRNINDCEHTFGEQEFSADLIRNLCELAIRQFHAECRSINSKTDLLRLSTLLPPDIPRRIKHMQYLERLHYWVQLMQSVMYYYKYRWGEIAISGGHQEQYNHLLQLLRRFEDYQTQFQNCLK